MKKTFKIYTIGCKTNQYETQAIRERMSSYGGYVECDIDRKADIYIINTCTVTAKADKDSRYSIRHCIKENPNAKIIVTGCLAELDGDILKDLPGVSLVVKNRNKYQIPEILTYLILGDSQSTLQLDKKEKYESQDLYPPLSISDFQGRSRAFIKVQDGCNNRCSYCKIPLVRGVSRSRELCDTLDEVKRILEKGFKELVLTGICLGSWGRDLKGDLRLSDLVEKVVRIDKDFRVRLSSIEPNMVSDELIRLIAENKKLCPHLHIPLQSGSNRILRLMNRPYSVKEYLFLVEKIKKTISDVAITTDVMVGFPGETVRDFKQTCNAIREIEPLRVHIFTYSRRKGTEASKYEIEMDSEVLKERKNKLEEIAIKTSFKYRKRFLKREVEGLIETERDRKTGFLTGYTAQYIRFFLYGKDHLKEHLVRLKVINVDLKSTFCIYL